MPGPPPAAGVEDGADFMELLLLDVLVLLLAAGVAADVLLLELIEFELELEELLDDELEEPLADLLMPL
jgi:hypothetical protein